MSVPASVPSAALTALADELRRHIVADLELDDVDPATIALEAPLFVEGLGLDSIDAVELVVMVERHYGIQLTDMQSAKTAFVSVASLTEFVAKNRAR